MKKRSTMTFGEFLAGEVARSGMNQTEAARYIGVPQNVLSSWCSGTRSPRLVEAMKAMRGFPRLLSWLIDHTFQEPFK
jgi:plasmid maintenance system antidote protein VapI